MMDARGGPTATAAQPAQQPPKPPNPPGTGKRARRRLNAGQNSRFHETTSARPCGAFQSGSCSAGTVGATLVCARDVGRVHVCARCGASDHGADNCPKFPKGKGKGKAKGRGAKGAE